MSERRSTFFRDGVSRVDFVLVQKRVKSEALRLQNYRFVANLRKMGLKVEREKGVKFEEYIFIKLHTPDDVLKRIADIHGVALTFEKDRTVPPLNNRWWIFKTAITRKINLQDPIFSRCTESVRGEPNKTYTNSERIMLTYFVLVRAKYGTLPDEYGLLNLLTNKNFEDAYPLHDGKWEWESTGPLNDRQVLCKFWANWKCFWKDQPTHLIYKYYGPEIAFHYAWLGFYTIMLLPVSILGVLTFILALIRMFADENQRVRIAEICYSDMDICPACVNPICLPEKLSAFCKDAMITYVVDNDVSIGFAILITVWASVFLEMWQRREYKLLYMWNLMNVKPDIDELPEYKQKTKNYVRINQYTGLKENFFPLKLQLRQYAISAMFCAIAILLLVVTVMCIRATVYFFRYTMYLSKIEFLQNYGDIISKMYSGLASVICIKLYTPVVSKISLILTDKEVHRTRNAYLNSYIFKSYVMSFFNTYTVLFYNAFFKDIKYTHPGDNYDNTFGMAADVCPPAIGCTASLSIHVFFIMLKGYLMMILTKSSIVPLLWKYAKKRIEKYGKKKSKKKDDLQDPHLPQWEIDFELIKPSEMFFLQSFTSSILEFGTVIFFVGALPLLPLMALFNNIAEIRLSSITLMKHIRRNVQTRVRGLGAWNTVMIIVTRISFVISGCVIVFTSRFVHRRLFKHDQGSFSGFVRDSVAAFLINDFEPTRRQNIAEKFPNLTVCYFTGYRNSYNETNKYQLSDRHYKVLSLQLMCLVIFVHVAFFLTHLVALVISKEPATIRECIQYEEHQMYAKNLEKINEDVKAYLQK